jgi:hypothetical protein
MGAQYWHKVASIRPANLIGYWPQWEPSGTDVNDYSGLGDRATSTGLGLAVAGADGVHQTRAFNGTPSHVNHLSAEFVTRFNPLELAILGWAKVAAAGQWTDGNIRQLVHIYTDDNNYTDIIKSVTNNRLIFSQCAGATERHINVTDATLGAAWFMYGLTISKSANQLKAYLKGVQAGATQTVPGVYAGALTVALIGAFDALATSPWLGYLDHYAVWNVALSASEVKQFSEV